MGLSARGTRSCFISVGGAILAGQLCLVLARSPVVVPKRDASSKWRIISFTSVFENTKSTVSRELDSTMGVNICEDEKKKTNPRTSIRKDNRGFLVRYGLVHLDEADEADEARYIGVNIYY